MNIVSCIQSFLSCKSISGPQFSCDGPRSGLIGVTGFMLGSACGVHLGFLLLSTAFYIFHKETFLLTLMHWSIYFVLLCSFHFLEFFSVASYNPKDLAYESYLINHSKEYTIALLAGWIEFWIESILFPDLKLSSMSIIIGLILVLGGQVVRHLAMRTCGEHFSHFIADERSEKHKLVTNGIYSVLRHPAYFGWFYWSIGTQLLLANPLCTVAYALASWHFFRVRIPFEERLLCDFYPEEYYSYMRRSFIGIPFISSYDPKKVD